MLHLRLIVPPARTDEVVALIDTTLGTTHVTVQPGAARRPPGDLVTCDAAREAVDTLLGGLRRLVLDAEGAITVENLDLTLSRHADEAEEEAPGKEADAVVWESVTEVTQEESTLTFTFLAFLTVAVMLAACGVVLDSAVLVVGAMVVGPDFGPLAGLSVALVQRRTPLARRSLTALLIGFPLAMAMTAGFSVVMDLLGMFEESAFEGARPETEFIWRPDPLSFVVALLAGVAGVLSLTSSKSGALVGVAISVTTVPAAANAAVALTYGDYPQTLGSAQQLGVNLVGIVIAGTLTLAAQKAFWERRARRAGVRTAAPRAPG